MNSDPTNIHPSKDPYILGDRAAEISVPGNKTIEEFIGRVSSGTGEFSVAKMVAPPGWEEPAQVPEFDELTLILSGKMRVEIEGDIITIEKDQPFIARKNCKVRYSNPFDTPAEYWAVCIPAFSNETVNREND